VPARSPRQFPTISPPRAPSRRDRGGPARPRSPRRNAQNVRRQSLREKHQSRHRAPGGEAVGTLNSARSSAAAPSAPFTMEEGFDRRARRAPTAGCDFLGAERRRRFVLQLAVWISYQEPVSDCR